MVRRHRRGFAAQQRRKLVWATHQITNLSLDPATATLVDLLDDYKTAGGSTQGITIARTHITGVVQAASSLSIAAGVFTGLLVTDSGDTSANISNSEEFYDWSLFQNQYAFGKITPGGTNVESQFSIDLKSKRKVQELGQNYTLVLQALSGTSGQTHVALVARTLLMLP